MPAKVDAEERRALLVQVAADLISAGGIAGLTNAAIAERMSASTTVVTHYFRDKRDLVLYTYQTMANRSRERIEDAAASADDPLRAWVRALLPLKEDTRIEWRVWLAFQGMAVGNDELLGIWNARQGSAVRRLADLIDADARVRGSRLRTSSQIAAEVLFAIVQGISFQAIVNPAVWTPARLRRVVDDQVAAIRAST